MPRIDLSILTNWFFAGFNAIFGALERGYASRGQPGYPT